MTNQNWLKRNYSPTIPALQTKTVKVYLNSLQSDQATFATLFGAISGLSELGNEVESLKSTE